EAMLWVGCDNGLTRLVEGGFRSFPEEPFLREDVQGMLSVDDGPARGVWIANTGGLYRFNDGRWTKLPLGESKDDDTPQGLLISLDGSLLVGTLKGRLLRFDGARLRPLSFPAEPGNFARSMAEAVDAVRGDELWIALR